MVFDPAAEWLEADGLGGFASGTVGLSRSRRYHALLLSATTPPTGRVALVNGFDAVVDDGTGPVAISSQRYAPDVRHPDGAARIRSFAPEPWPTWEFDLPGGGRIRQEIVVEHETGVVLVRWSLVGGRRPVGLRVRPFLSGRDYHSLMHENGAFRFEPDRRDASLAFRPYDGLPAIAFDTNGAYAHAPAWYRQFLYAEEQARGLDALEDLASPGELVFDLADGGPAIWLMRADDGPGEPQSGAGAAARAEALVEGERRRRARFAAPIDRAVDAYIVRRRAGRTIVAGYPWFTDWGRDTFIALRGLCLATGRLDDAKGILLEWSGAVSEGMLPNRFPDRGESAEFNAVDASLWFVVAVREFLDAAGDDAPWLSRAERERLDAAVVAIVDGYAKGTRYGIRMDDDGLLAAGVPGVQLTWMDARVGDRVITPRIGKPVEVQALWVNALAAAAQIEPRRSKDVTRATAAFGDRFWYDEGGYLCDVVDVDHVGGTRDVAFRPNQVLAVGGLPVALVTGTRARRIVDEVERRLLTPLGLRSLAPGEAGYAPRYVGDSSARDAVYHQGTVWPWLLGAFVDAWVRVRKPSAALTREARERFLDPLLAHLAQAGIGHVSEIADAEPPFTPRGCPFQAWSLGELVRLDRQILAVPRRRSDRPAPARLRA